MLGTNLVLTNLQINYIVYINTERSGFIADSRKRAHILNN